MKKYLITVLSLFAFVLPLISSAQTAEIYVHNLEATKTKYNTGEIIEGKFDIFNVSDFAQSNIYYREYLGNKIDGQVVNTLTFDDKKGPLFLEAGSQRSINFSYKVPDQANGKMYFEIRAELVDGTIVGWANIPMSISGNQAKPSLFASDVGLNINNELHEIVTGPTVFEEDVVTLEFLIGATSNISTITPTVSLFNRVHASEVLENWSADKIITSTTEPTKVILKLPTHLKPLVYAGTVSFASSEVFVNDINFRYIIGGAIATVRNISSDTLTIKKNQTFNVEISYAGVPEAFNNPSRQFDLNGTTVLIEVKNELGQIVSETTLPLDIEKSDNMIIPLRANQKAEKLSISATIYDKDGNNLSSLTTDLPSQAEVDKNYGKETKKDSNLIVLISLGVLILLILILVLIKKILPKDSLVAFVLITTGVFGGLVLFASPQTLDAFTVWYQQYDKADFNKTPRLVSVQSPVPSSVGSYNPGDTFDLTVSIGLGSSNSASSAVETYFTKTNSWVDVNLGDPVLKSESDWFWHRFNDWWINDKGTRVYYNTTTQNASNPGVYSLGSYQVPNEPGKYRIYFGAKLTYKIHAYQEICVTGAGICKDEVLDSSCTVTNETKTIIGLGRHYDDNGNYEWKRKQPYPACPGGYTKLPVGSAQGDIPDDLCPVWSDVKETRGSNPPIFKRQNRYYDAGDSLAACTVKRRVAQADPSAHPGYENTWCKGGNDDCAFAMCTKQIQTVSPPNCQTPPADVCKNIVGNQTEPPLGHQLEGENCVQEEVSCDPGWSPDENGVCVSNTEMTSVSCSVSPSTTVITEQEVEFSASANGTPNGTVSYSWTNTIPGTLESHSGSSFQKSFLDQGQYQYSVSATDRTKTVSKLCGVTVDNLNITTDMRIGEFYFSPSVVRDNQQCKIFLSTTNADSCTINGVLLEHTSYTDGNSPGYNPGSYTVACTDTEGVVLKSGPKKCAGLGDTIEN